MQIKLLHGAHSTPVEILAPQNCFLIRIPFAHLSTMELDMRQRKIGLADGAT